MIEQKFASAGGASFVNPYHGTSDQLYTPTDYSEVAQNLGKLFSTTYKQIQDNAFRQGQIDQLANAVDTDRWLGKDQYLKGAKYAKAQIDLQTAMGKAQDIVNTAIANGKGSEEMLEEIRKSQEGLFDVATELRGTNPSAADNLINQLRNVQGAAVKNHAEQMVAKTNEYRMNGDYMSVNSFLSNSAESARLSNQGFILDEEATYNGLKAQINAIDTNATVMGVDKLKYRSQILGDSFQNMLTNAKMDSPEAVGLVNSMTRTMDRLVKDGYIDPKTSLGIKVFAENKLGEARQYYIAQASIVANNPEMVYTPELEQQFSDMLTTMKVMGVEPMTLASLLNGFSTKKATFLKADGNAKASGMAPLAGSPGSESWRKGLAQEVLTQHKAIAAQTGTTVSPQEVSKDIITQMCQFSDFKGSHKYIEGLATTLTNGMSASGDFFSDDVAHTAMVLSQLINSKDPNIRMTVRDHLGPKLSIFLDQQLIPAIQAASASAGDKKPEVIKEINNNLHEAWSNLNSGSTYKLGDSITEDTKIANWLGEGVANKYTFFGYGFGGLGFNDGLAQVLAPTMKAYTPNITTMLKSAGTTLMEGKELETLQAVGVVQSLNGGYTMISPNGNAPIFAILGSDDNTTREFIPEVLQSTLTELAKRKNIGLGDVTSTFGNSDVALFLNPDTGGLEQVFEPADSGMPARHRYTNREVLDLYDKLKDDYIAQKQEAASSKIVSASDTRPTEEALRSRIETVTEEDFLDKESINTEEAIGDHIVKISDGEYVFITDPEKLQVQYQKIADQFAVVGDAIKDVLNPVHDYLSDLDRATQAYRAGSELSNYVRSGAIGEDTEAGIAVGIDALAEGAEKRFVEVGKYAKGIEDSIDHSDADPEVREQAKEIWKWLSDPTTTSPLTELIKDAGSNTVKAIKLIMDNAGDYLKDTFRAPNLNLAMDAYNALQGAEDGLSFIGQHILNRVRHGFYGPNGKYYPPLNQRDADVIERFMANPEGVGPLHANTLGNIYRRYAVDAIGLFENLMDISNKNVTPVKVSNGKNGFETFYTTGAMSGSVFGQALGNIVMSELAKEEGMLLNWTATNPKVTKDPVIGIGYKRGYPAWDKRFEAAEGDAIALSRVTCEFATWYFNNIPTKFSKATGTDWERATTNPMLLPVIVATTDYAWHAGRNANGYYEALELVKQNKLDAAMDRLKASAPYKQSGFGRKMKLEHGLRAYYKFWHETEH